jgi:hypothetical protein
MITFKKLISRFANRADLIIMLFDAHKLDISDEFRNVIESLKGNDDKIRCILNKADQVDRQKLVRVYGALMWSLGKVVKTPEVLRVYIGSFWDQPLVFEDNAQLFEMEERDLMRDLKDLPRNSAVRKINELVKRVRICKVHAYIISHLKEQMPMMMGHAKKQKTLIETLPTVFRTVMKRFNLAPGDFPDINDFQEKLQEMDFRKFHTLKQRLIDDIDSVLGNDIPRLMEALPRSLDTMTTALANAHLDSHGPLIYESPPSSTPNGIYSDDGDSNPWGDNDGDQKEQEWALNEYIPMYKPKFDEIQKGGFVSGGGAKSLLTASGIPTGKLRKIWELSDIDKDGNLDLQEFVIAMFLTDACKEGQELPSKLDEDMIPPGKISR